MPECSSCGNHARSEREGYPAHALKSSVKVYIAAAAMVAALLFVWYLMKKRESNFSFF